MDLIMFHSGGDLPTYLEFTFGQIRLFNPNVTIHFLTDAELVRDPLFKKYNVIAVNKDLYYSNKIEIINLAYKRKQGDFWAITTTRLVYMENYIYHHDLRDIYHFENDVLLYCSLDEFDCKFKTLFPYLAITVGGDTKCMTGFMFIKNSMSLFLMTHFFINLLQKYTIKEIIKKYGVDMVHEMSLMRIYGLERGEHYLSILPSLPRDDHFDDFHSLFDAAAWGQYVGGTTDGIPGAKPLDHYVSQVLIEHPEYTVIWGKDQQNRKIPYFKMGDKKIRINNLHIHSKNLHLYTS